MKAAFFAVALVGCSPAPSPRVDVALIVGQGGASARHPLGQLTADADAPTELRRIPLSGSGPFQLVDDTPK